MEESGQAQKTNKTETLKQGGNEVFQEKRGGRCGQIPVNQRADVMSRLEESVVLDVEDLKTFESAVGSRCMV